MIKGSFFNNQPAKANIDYALVKTSTNYSLTQSSIDYSLAKAVIKYSLATAYSYLDEKGLNKLFKEIVSSLDSAVLLTEKVFADGQQIDSQTFIETAKVLSELISSTDSLPVLSLEKHLSDIQGQSELTYFSVIKLLADTSVPIDNISTKQTTKVLSDLVGSIDSKTFTFTKRTVDLVLSTDQAIVSFNKSVPGETQPQTDSFSRVVSFLRTYVENLSLSDTFNKTVSYSRNFSDIVTVPDRLVSIFFGDVEIDGVVVDPFGVDDDPAILINKPFYDYAVSTDNRYHTFSTTKQDIVSPSDSFSRIANYLRTYSDTVISTDSFSRVNEYYRTYSDTQSNIDDFSRVVDYVRSYDDYILQHDEKIISFSALYSDQAFPEDSLTSFNTNLLKTDDQHQEDYFYRNVDYFRNFADIVTIPDYISSIFFGDVEVDGVVVDPFGVDDDPAISINKPFADDYSVTIDLYGSQFITSRQEYVYSSDSQVLYTDLVKGDTQEQEDSHFAEFNKFSDEDYYTVDDSHIFDTDLVKTDTQEQEDSLYRTVDYTRNFSDLVFATDYISSIFFGENPIDGIITDPFGIDDDPAIDINKPLTDTYNSFVDLHGLNFIASRYEIVTSSDELKTKEAGKGLSDQQQQTETTKFDNTKELSDEQQTTETKSLSTSYPKDDTQYTTDLYASTFIAHKDETIPLVDAYSRIVDFVREYTDEQSQADNIKNDVTKSLSDIFGVTDDIFIARTIRTAYSDSVDAVEDSIRESTKSLEDFVSFQETITITFGGITRYFEDSYSDYYESGLIRIGDYVVDYSDYFAEDYIGRVGYITNVNYYFTELLSDLSVPADSFSRIVQFSRSFADTQLQTDAIYSIGFGKVYNDNQVQTDSAYRSFGKSAVGDTQIQSDTFSRSVIFDRTYSDNQNQTDAATRSFGKTAAGDTQNQSDSFDRIVNYSKTYNDVQNQSDFITKFDSIKVLNDSQIQLDSIARDVNKLLTDLQLQSDEGKVFINTDYVVDYSSYFSDVYAGELASTF